jgi:exopolyphosphatase / guanosine-5'-triphosphate,3'-diphosphate pyrophosphatase
LLLGANIGSDNLFGMDKTRAIIDIGTNSIKLLVGRVEGTSIIPVFETSNQTRLGKGLYASKRLEPGAIAATAGAVRSFAAEAHRLGADRVRVIATSAMREAPNARELQDAIVRECGLNVEVISGDREADLAFRGVCTDPALAGKKLLLLDMGGGSTEMILGEWKHKQLRQSFPLGTLRIMANVRISENAGAQELAACRQWLRGFVRKEISPLIMPALESARKDAENDPLLTGTGGTATILARIEAGINSYDRRTIERTRILTGNMRQLTEKLWALPLQKRRQVPGLPPERADVILPGVAAYEVLMEELGFQELRVSTRGLRFAALLN